MHELPVVILLSDARGDVERAASRLRDTGLRNPMIHLRGLDDLLAWQAGYTGEIAFLIMHADTRREMDQGDAAPRLPVYPVFAVQTIDSRLMAAVWLSPGAAAIGPVPFDAPAVVRSLPRIGLHWLVI